MYCPYKPYIYFCPIYGNYSLPRQNPPISVKPKNIEYKNNIIEVSLRIPVLESPYHKQIISKINASVENDIMEFKDQIEEGAKYHAEKMKAAGKPVKPFVASNVYQITYDRNNVLSMTLLYYALVNSISNYVKTSYTYDLTTGKAMSLGDLFKQGVDYIPILNYEIRKELTANKQKYLPDTIKNFAGIARDQPFYLDDSSIAIFLGFNEVAPISAEIPIILIPFSNLRNVLKPSLL